MMNTSKVLSLLACVTSVALFAACGGGGSDSSSDTTTPYPTLVTSTVTTALPQDQVTDSEYKFAAWQDNLVLTNNQTELWGHIYAPANMPAGQKYPLVVMLHGNHATCGTGMNPITQVSSEYTFDGTCANTSSNPINSHLGYAYLANQLAASGIIVVSVNANRGITGGVPLANDGGLNLARGRLILRHLALLNGINQTGAPPAGTTAAVTDITGLQALKGHIDFSNVGLMGHSRGGEGVRAAYFLSAHDPVFNWSPYLDSSFAIKAIYEISPVDGQTSLTLNSANVAWGVMVGLCDGDVIDLEGLKPYDRDFAFTSETPAMPKSVTTVWGANHDFFNTQWQNSESAGCAGTGNNQLWTAGDYQSTSQQNVASSAVVPFFQAHLLGSTKLTFLALANILNPLNTSALTTTTQTDRTFVSSPASTEFAHLEDFASTDARSTVLNTNATVTYGNIPEHDKSLNAAQIQWTSLGGYFETTWTTPQTFTNTNAVTLDFRAGRAEDTTNNTDAATDFSVQLMFANNVLGAKVQVSKYATLNGPAATMTNGYGNYYHFPLTSVRIPLSALLAGNENASVVGVHFAFDQSTSGDIYLTNIGVARYASDSAAETYQLTTTLNTNSAWNLIANITNTTPATASPTSVSTTLQKATTTQASTSAPTSTQNKIQSAVRKTITTVSGTSSDVIEIYSASGFGATNALPELYANGTHAAYGSTPASGTNAGDLHYLRFTLDPNKSVSSSAQLSVGFRERSKMQRMAISPVNAGQAEE